MDLLGPLPKSLNGFQYIIVASDYATRYIEVAPLRSAKAKMVARFFINNIISRHGCPKIVLTDRGTHFTLSVLQQVLNTMGSQHIKTTAYHPQTDGLVERLNRTIADYLAHYVDHNRKNWDEYVPFFQLACKSSVKASLQYSPFKLVYGREANLPIDVTLSPALIADPSLQPP